MLIRRKHDVQSVDPGPGNLLDATYLIGAARVGECDVAIAAVEEKPHRVDFHQWSEGELDHVFGILPARSASCLGIDPADRHHGPVRGQDLLNRFALDPNSG